MRELLKRINMPRLVSNLQYEKSFNMDLAPNMDLLMGLQSTGVIVGFLRLFYNSTSER